MTRGTTATAYRSIWPVAATLPASAAKMPSTDIATVGALSREVGSLSIPLPFNEPARALDIARRYRNACMGHSIAFHSMGDIAEDADLEAVRRFVDDFGRHLGGLPA